MSKNKTKNDLAWEILFEKHQILDRIEKNGIFEIEAAQINKERESRLMAKFDHYVNLPQIFKNNHLSILPISRSKYVIGQFKTHFPVEYNPDLETTNYEFLPDLESIDETNLYSEFSALLCAFNLGIINDLIGEDSLFTVSGRMSTGCFDFNIINSTTKQPYLVKVENSQCEIDAGFESKNYFLLIEAKKYLVDDFLIRQLYYPYRLWSQKLNKTVIPILMTYSNDIFSFFIYKFERDIDYNSLVLVEQKNYAIAPEEIHQSDVDSIWKNIQLVPEPLNIPFPQANSFERLVDLLSLLLEKDLTKDEITENYEFDSRQTYYYTAAGRYLGLIEQDKNIFSLSSEARIILGNKQKTKNLALIKKILEHQVFYEVFKLTLNTGEIPSEKPIADIMSQCNLNISNSTKERRASTVRGWIFWIWNQI